MREIVGNILDMNDGVIFQCVNTLGKMGAGLALQTAKAFPRVKQMYEARVFDAKTTWNPDSYGVTYPDSLLGTCLREGRHVLLFTQKTIGRSGKHTNIDALNRALQAAKYEIRRSATCYFPYGMGCGLGGGDWTRVYQLIQHHFPDGIIVRLPETKG